MCRVSTYKFSFPVTLVWILAFTSSVIATPGQSPELTSWINGRFEQHFNELGQQITTVDDATFLRRVYLDLSGRIPTIAQIRDFTADQDADKRLKAIDKLLADERFDTHTARVWRRILMPPSTQSNPVFAAALDEWLQEQFKNNTRYDQIARRLVTAGGADTEQAAAIKAVFEEAASANIPYAMGQLKTSPTSFLQHSGGQPANMASSVSRVFLGVRLECAQCHDHPFTEWKQKDFWGVAAFFAGAKLSFPTNPAAQEQMKSGDASLADGRNTSISDADGNSYGVSLPWDAEDATVSIPAEELPRQYFARWMTSADNPHFAATAVNRVWQHLCGEGLTESVDDLDQATNEERGVVLDGLAKKFAEHDFNLKALIRAICASKYYQRTSQKQATTTDIAPRPLKVMTPEQVFDSYEVAVSLPISSIDEGPRFNGEREALVSRMEEALGERPDDFRAGIPQALTLMNGKTTADATDLKKSRTLRAVVDAPFLAIDEKVDTLFLVTLSRAPHESERAKLLQYIQDRPSDQEKAEAFSEVMWALINSPEFVLVR